MNILLLFEIPPLSTLDSRPFCLCVMGASCFDLNPIDVHALGIGYGMNPFMGRLDSIHPLNYKQVLDHVGHLPPVTMDNKLLGVRGRDRAGTSDRWGWSVIGKQSCDFPDTTLLLFYLSPFNTPRSRCNPPYRQVPTTQG